MAQYKAHLKQGMGGSRNGRGRSVKTAELKDVSKKARRQEAKRAAQEE